MFERFTDRARSLVVAAQEEARQLKHDHVGSEHLFVAFMAGEEGGGKAAITFGSLNIKYKDVRREVKREFPVGKERLEGHIPFTPGLKKIFERALREALQLGHNYIGTEHILLAFAWELDAHPDDHPITSVLDRMPVKTKTLRQTVLRLLQQPYAGPASDYELDEIALNVLLTPRELGVLEHALDEHGTGSFEFKLGIARLLERRARKLRKELKNS